jgi:hypothetical protein
MVRSDDDVLGPGHCQIEIDVDQLSEATKAELLEKLTRVVSIGPDPAGSPSIVAFLDAARSGRPVKRINATEPGKGGVVKGSDRP